MIADRDADTGTAAANEVDGEFVAVDVSDAEQVERLFAVTVERFGRVDVSFHNAGISPPDDDSILTTDLDAWRRVQDVNLTSVFLCCKAVLPHMQRQGKGSIINTASFVATMGSATSQISYTASKGGVLALSRELGVQFAREGIRVNALCPGPGEHAVAGRSCSPPIPNARSAAWCTCHGTLRRARGDRGRGRVPRQRRLVVHDRVHVPGRRRDLRGLRHPCICLTPL